ncbi:MAG: hypothetical protein JXQ96_17510 [Cyclobacteriaceae bacterium]
MKPKLLLILFCFLSLPMTGQHLAINEHWWSNLVGWDGVSHWSEYQIHSPAFLGPNALPVPNVSDGRVNNISALTMGGQAHFSDGDNTQNITLYLNYNFLKDVISIDLFFIPTEFFQMSHAKKEERNVYYRYYDVSNATGDAYLNTTFRVLNQEKNKIDMAIRIGLKTASGGNANPARFTDTPGYYFDTSIGKAIGSDQNWRPYAMLGFYSWETNDDTLPQNDALMYGFGLEYLKNGISIKNELTGYNGYKKNGDKPSVYRLTFSKELTRLVIGAKYQHGLRDYDYKTFEASLGYKFNKG